MTLGIITKLWKRYELTRAFLRYYAGLKVPGVELRLYAAASFDEDPGMEDVVQDFPTWTATSVPNEPLSAKTNAACRLAYEDGVDAVMNVGSDDFASPAYIRRCVDEIERGVDYLGPEQIWFYDLPTGRCYYATHNTIGGTLTVGAGRCMSRRALDAVRGEPWEPKGKRPDWDYRLLMPMTPLPDLREHGLALVDVKSETNIGRYHNVVKCGGEEEDGAALLEKHFPADMMPVHA